MDFIRQWFLGIAGAAVIGTAALAVTPPGTVKKVLQIGVSLLIVIAVLHPLTGWNGSALLETQFFGLTEQTEFEKTGQEALTAIIAERTAAYIENEAQAMGLVVTVTVKCRMGDYYPEPWAVTVRSQTPVHAKNALENLIERDTGIPPERQTFAQDY